MKSKTGVNRRTFLQNAAVGAGMTAVAAGAPAIASSANQNGKLVLGHVGCGVRGYQLIGEAMEVPGVEYRGICDLFDGYLERGQKRINNPALKITKAWQEIIGDKDIDAVIISVPDHWHYEIALAAVEAGKHVYLEKPFVNTLPQAKTLVKAIREKGITFQLGHQERSNPGVWKARELVQKGTLGNVVHVRTQHYRNSKVPYLRWYWDYDTFEMPSTADLDHIDWDRFQSNVRRHPFSPFRFFHWRCYWDYTNGVAGDLQSHAMDEVDAILGMGIPESCSATGGLYYWRDGRDTPDTWNAIFDYPNQGLSINYASVAMSDHYDTGVQIMGKDAALDLKGSQIQVFAERVSDKYKDQVDRMLQKAGGDWAAPRREPIETYSPEASPEESSHMFNWIRGIRENRRTRGNVDTAWVEIVTVLMAYESFRRRRVVTWDKENEEIV